MTLIYPGSFDPVTLGHIDIATRGAKLCGHLVVAVLDNTNKTPHFSTPQRVLFLKDALGHIPNITVDSFSGLLVEYAKQKNATAILRGLRTPGDLESEAMYAHNNKLLSAHHEPVQQGLETIFLPATPAYSFISSTIVREVAGHIYQGHLRDTVLSGMATPAVIAGLEEKYLSKKPKLKG